MFPNNNGMSKDISKGYLPEQVLCCHHARPISPQCIFSTLIFEFKMAEYGGKYHLFQGRSTQHAGSQSALTYAFGHLNAFKIRTLFIIYYNLRKQGAGTSVHFEACEAKMPSMCGRKEQPALQGANCPALATH